MATNAQLYDLVMDTSSNASDPAVEKLRKRATASVAIAAVAILFESSGITNHAARLVWSKAVLMNRDATKAQAERMLWSLATDATVQTGSITDAALNTLVAGFVDAYTG